MQYLIFIVGWRVRPTTILANRMKPWFDVVNPTIEPGFFSTENGWVFGMVYHIADDSPTALNRFPESVPESFLQRSADAYLKVPEEVRDGFISTDSKLSSTYATVVSAEWLSAHVQPAIELFRHEEINTDLLRLVTAGFSLETAIHA